MTPQARPGPTCSLESTGNTVKSTALIAVFRHLTNSLRSAEDPAEAFHETINFFFCIIVYKAYTDDSVLGIFYAQGVKANVLFFDRKPASATPWTEKLWIYDLRTNTHFTLKQNPLTRADLDGFVECYRPENRHERTPTWSDEDPDGRWRAFAYDELMARDKVNLDIFWLRDESLEDTADLPNPDVLAAEIVEDLQAALEQFREIAEELGGRDNLEASVLER